MKTLCSIKDHEYYGFLDSYVNIFLLWNVSGTMKKIMVRTFKSTTLDVEVHYAEMV